MEGTTKKLDKKWRELRKNSLRNGGNYGRKGFKKFPYDIFCKTSRQGIICKFHLHKRFAKKIF